MYGTVATLRVKAGSEDAFSGLPERWWRENAPKAKGALSTTLLRTDRDPREYILIAVFDSKENYEANAENPEQDQWYQQLRACLEADPVWSDGEIVFSEHQHSAMTTTDSSVTEFLSGHRAGILATINRSGTPQQTLIGYRFDGNDIAISTRATSLKAKNVSKRPGVSLAITDGRSQLIVYGKVEIVRELDTVFALHRGRGLLGDRQTSDAEFKELLESEKRVVLVLRPEKFYPTTMRRA